MITLPLTMRGTPVIVYGSVVSVVCTDQTSLPVLLSSAIKRPSSTPTKILPFQAATPRLTTAQHASAALDFAAPGSYSHSFAPERMANAVTMLHAAVRYITPSTTTALDSWPRSASSSAYQPRPAV